MIESDGLNRLITSDLENNDEWVIDRAIRPICLEDYEGQDPVREQMRIFIDFWSTGIRQDNFMPYYCS